VETISTKALARVAVAADSALRSIPVVATVAQGVRVRIVGVMTAIAAAVVVETVTAITTATSAATTTTTTDHVASASDIQTRISNRI
jgi:hypothetical protein